MPDRDELLEAHVRFELQRWSGPERSAMLRDEIAALFDWLRTVAVGDVITPEHLDEVLNRLVFAEPVDDDTVETVAAALRGLHESALIDETPIGELAGREAYNEVAETLIGMKDTRSRVTEQLTSSEVYSELLAHVLYQGIKNYLTTESVLARRVPGASSLMRFGQSALSNAAPKLGEGIDRQLIAFVNANISDTIRESRHYLDRVLDDETLWTVANELWDSNASTPVRDAAALVTPDEIDLMVRAARDAWEHARQRPQAQAFVSRLAHDLLARERERSIADLLASARITADRAADTTELVADPWIDRAVADGYLEQRLRVRLAEFYAQFFDQG